MAGQTLKSDQPHVTEFRRLVYDATRQIPPARAATYGWVARTAGCGSPRAVGGALRANPFAPEVPCHRVVSADGSLTGFGGSSDTAALKKKRRLLESEGVRFDVNGRVDPACLLTPDRP